jgi:hypothetical protein
VFKAVPYGNTKPFDEEGEVIYVEDVDYLSQDVKGKIVVTYGRVRGEGYEKLIEKGVKGTYFHLTSREGIFLLLHIPAVCKRGESDSCPRS